jgi:hypothetical protein
MKAIARSLLLLLFAALLLIQLSCKPRSHQLSTTPETASTQSVVAASNSQPPEAQAQENGAGRERGDSVNYAQRAQERFERMKTALTLTEDQAQKVQTILDQQHTAIQSLRGDQSIPRDQRMAKVRELRDNENSQIRALLTPDQQTKWDAEVQRREQEMAARRAQWLQGGFGGGFPQ